MNNEIINLIFKTHLPTTTELEQKYPPRNLPKDALITRQGPSPTGFAHFGLIYAALASRKLADTTNGIFYLRIEDTDKEREVENGASILINAIKDFGIKIDEGPISENQSDEGIYGPYIQSKRKDIYQSFAKKLLEENKAYPCFCSKEELDEIRKTQTEQKLVPGYYGKWAKWRNATDEEILNELNKNTSFVLRFKAQPHDTNRITVNDAINGEISFPINILEDFVILKTDGLPTYHFAHVIDDHLMRTTLVLRSTEWISSLPKHIQLFEALNFYTPTYAHLAPIEKMIGSTRRKLSKRKDPEADVYNYLRQGYEPEAVKAYLLNLLTSQYDEYILGKDFVYDPNYVLTLDKMKGGSGALLDLQKLDDYSASYMANLSAVEAYKKLLSWSQKYDSRINKIITEDESYTIEVLSIERGGENPRKDIKKWSDFYDATGFMFDEVYTKLNFETESIKHIDKDLTKNILMQVLNTYNENDTKDIWLQKIKDIAKANNFAIDRKELKNEPQKFTGFWADLPALIRVAVAKKNKSPDLYEVMKILKRTKIENRFTILCQEI
jgi:glutamyl-tRNA synthetase